MKTRTQVKKTNAKKMFRQGDVSLVEIDKQVLATKKLVKKDNIVAYGEVTGHKHQFLSPQVEIFVDELGTQYISVLEKAELIHDTHGKHVIPKGTYYKYNPQRELNLVNEIQKVVD
jgi:hypothetical protein